MKNFKIIIFIYIFSFSLPIRSSEGIWQGIFDINGHGVYDFTCLIYSKNVTAYTEKAKVVYNGEIENKNKIFKIKLNMFLKDGTKFGNAELKGEYIEKNIMSGRWLTTPAKDYGNIYLKKIDEQYAKDTRHIVNKKWVSFDNIIEHKIVIKNYKISGYDESKCNYYGNLKILNNKIFGIDIEIASCGASDGLYNGMAHINKDNNLIINATNKDFSIFLKLK